MLINKSLKVVFKCFSKNLSIWISALALIISVIALYQTSVELDQAKTEYLSNKSLEYSHAIQANLVAREQGLELSEKLEYSLIKCQLPNGLNNTLLKDIRNTTFGLSGTINESLDVVLQFSAQNIEHGEETSVKHLRQVLDSTNNQLVRNTRIRSQLNYVNDVLCASNESKKGKTKIKSEN